MHLHISMFLKNWGLILYLCDTILWLKSLGFRHNFFYFVAEKSKEAAPVPKLSGGSDRLLWLSNSQGIPATPRPGAVARSEASSLGMQAAPEFDPHIWHILSWKLGHENISTAILPLPLIQEEQLSVTGERMCTKYW